MKLIIAIVRPENLAAVQAAVDEREASLMAVSQVLADKREPGCTGVYRGSEFHIRWLHLRLEIAVDDWCVDAAVAAILHAGSTGTAGQVGDCKVYVMPLDKYVASEAVPEERQGAVVSLVGTETCGRR